MMDSDSESDSGSEIKSFTFDYNVGKQDNSDDDSERMEQSAVEDLSGDDESLNDNNPAVPNTVRFLSLVPTDTSSVNHVQCDALSINPDTLVNTDPDPFDGIDLSIVSMPTFVQDYQSEWEESSKSPEIKMLINKQLYSENWITDDLEEQISKFIPLEKHIDRNDDNKRDRDAFNHYMSKFFFVGRMFASYVQLNQVSQMLLDRWAVQIICGGKAISCHFAKPENKKKSGDILKQSRVHQESLKQNYQCPFKIRYVLHTAPKQVCKQAPTLLYMCRITHVVLEHTCPLSSISHRAAVQTSGKAQPNISKLANIVAILRARPKTRTSLLRPLILDALPKYQDADAKFIDNFRRRVVLFNAKHGQRELCHDDIKQLVPGAASGISAAEEVTAYDDPFFKKNLTDMLREVMQNDSSTWQALQFLENAKKASPGFDFEVCREESGKPIALCWMSSQMKSDLLRFGNVLFLDAQKRQYNCLQWPYIGPVVKDSNMKVRVVLESLVIEETH